ncbi:uncharacterized protein LOC62_05G007569 [Vanrija pseudolonga]|uniref:Uncharacterized protein n=1 Tax=Vanrija pseudolonga TaxID=143232 RepID=A0AAF0YG72_9TREE|nr:hypothetical protein LOC62_05G007569 [Vanrija pseudolonga]
MPFTSTDRGSGRVDVQYVPGKESYPSITESVELLGDLSVFCDPDASRTIISIFVGRRLGAGGMTKRQVAEQVDYLRRLAPQHGSTIKQIRKSYGLLPAQLDAPGTGGPYTSDSPNSSSATLPPGMQSISRARNLFRRASSGENTPQVQSAAPTPATGRSPGTMSSGRMSTALPVPVLDTIHDPPAVEVTPAADPRVYAHHDPASTTSAAAVEARAAREARRQARHSTGQPDADAPRERRAPPPYGPEDLISRLHAKLEEMEEQMRELNVENATLQARLDSSTMQTETMRLELEKRVAEAEARAEKAELERRLAVAEAKVAMHDLEKRLSTGRTPTPPPSDK